jgi:hypothetical protein
VPVALLAGVRVADGVNTFVADGIHSPREQAS